jgi:multicomponent Na+:H+ antiporter subunit E
MRIGIASSLVVLWLLLWGDLSVANVLSGIAIATLLLAAFPGDRRADAERYVIRPIAALRLTAYFLVQLVSSNILLVREVLSRRSRVHTAVVACQLETSSSRLTTVIMDLIALTPGTMTVEMSRDPTILYVHVLRLDDVEKVRASVSRLESLVVAAFGPLPGPLAAARGNDREPGSTTVAGGNPDQGERT